MTSFAPPDAARTNIEVCILVQDKDYNVILVQDEDGSLGPVGNFLTMMGTPDSAAANLIGSHLFERNGIDENDEDKLRLVFNSIHHKGSGDETVYTILYSLSSIYTGTQLIDIDQLPPLHEDRKYVAVDLEKARSILPEEYVSAIHDPANTWDFG